MTQWSVLVLLTVSIFVGRAYPLLQKGHDTGTLNDTVNITANANNTIPVPSPKAAEDKKDTLKVTNSSSPSINATNTNALNATVTNTNATNTNATHTNVTHTNATHTNDKNANITVPPVNEKGNCNSTKEEVDMLNCYVTSRDNDEDTEEEVSTNTPESTTITVTASNKTEVNSTESQVPKSTPSKTKGKDKNKGVDVNVVLLNRTEAHDTSYEVATTEPSDFTNTSDADTDSKLGTNSTKVLISSVAPLVADNAPSTGSKDVVQELKSDDQSRKKGRPAGMITLVIAISFAVLIAIVYIGMIVWRRYIEYRYGHRELLVNELEFDTNDLRHFEL